MGPEARGSLTRPLGGPTPHRPVTRLAEQARRSGSWAPPRTGAAVLAQGAPRPRRRLEQAGQEQAWGLASALTRGSPNPCSGRRVGWSGKVSTAHGGRAAEVWGCDA